MVIWPRTSESAGSCSLRSLLFLFGVSAAQCPLGIAFMPPSPFSRWLMLPAVAASARGSSPRSVKFVGSGELHSSDPTKVGPGGVYLFGASAKTAHRCRFLTPSRCNALAHAAFGCCQRATASGVRAPGTIKCLDRMGKAHPIQECRPWGALTPDPRIKSPLLYQLSYRPVGKIIGKKSA